MSALRSSFALISGSFLEEVDSLLILFFHSAEPSLLSLDWIVTESLLLTEDFYGGDTALLEPFLFTITLRLCSYAYLVYIFSVNLFMRGEYELLSGFNGLAPSSSSFSSVSVVIVVQFASSCSSIS